MRRFLGCDCRGFPYQSLLVVSQLTSPARAAVSFTRFAGQMTSKVRVVPPNFGQAISLPRSSCRVRLRRRGWLLGQWGAKCKESRLNLVRIEVNLHLKECGREFVHVVRTGPFREPVGKELGLIGRQTHLARRILRASILEHCCRQGAFILQPLDAHKPYLTLNMLR